LRIPFNQPGVAGKELEYVAEAARSGHVAGDGPFTRKCHEWLEQSLGVHRALLTTSCSDALEMAALLLKLAPGDEVVVPSFAFVTTASAFVLHGARPVFIDIRPDTLNLDETQLERLVTPRTRAIVVLHYAAVACEMDPILDIAARRGIAVIEDNAHGLLARYQGRYLGTMGSLATQSFHETKNFHCGEGGALLINDPQYAERAEIVREKGTNRSRFFRGQVDKYTWVDVGSSFLPSDLLAAFLWGQFEAADRIQQRRRRIWERYRVELAGWAEAGGVRLPVTPAHCEQSYHMFYLLLPSVERRQALIAHLKSHGILAVFHYLPLHLSDMGRKLGGRPGDCPVTEEVSDRLLRLPLYYDLSENQQSEVIDRVRAFHV
jgi:dTDP-4-amino-4,6-dideoxygalactose transaminase